MDKNYNYEKVEKWKRLLGEQTYNYCEEHNKKFKRYLSNQIKVEYNLEKEIELILSVKSNCVEKYSVDVEDVCFEQFYERLVRYAVYKLTEALRGTERFWKKSLYSDFVNHLVKQLQEMCMRTLIIKMNEYRENKKLVGNDSREEYNYFCNEIVGDSCFVKNFFLEFPALYYCVKRKIHYIVQFYKEIIENFIADIQDIEHCLCKDRRVNAIGKVYGNFSDVHNEGKQVVKIELDNGDSLYYKPHSMKNEKLYMKMLQWISKKTNIQQKSYLFLSYENHSWTTIVKYKSCENEEQLKNYYLRMGVQLFLVYLLSTKDLHYENIIAAGEYPVLIDLETLVNICYNKERESVNDEILYQLAQSVLYTGLLPYCSWNNEGKGIDNSAISGGRSGKYPFKVPVIINAKTSEMAVSYDYPQIREKKNLATIKGVFQNPERYKEEIILGFSKAYREVMKHKKEFCDFYNEIPSLESRFLVRDTQYYSMLISSSYHPSLLMNSMEREIFLNVIRKSDKDEELVNSEINSMLKGDIPYFYYKLDDTALYDMGGKVRKNYFRDTPLKVLQDKLYALCKSDLEKQCEYIEISLGLTVGSQENYINRTYSVEQMQKSNNQTMGLEEVKEELIERLLSQAVWNKECTEVSWSVLQFTHSDTNNWTIIPMGYYMYEGLAGMLLLFQVLSKTAEDTRINTIKDTLQRMVFNYTDKANISLDNLQTRKTGIYEGESSIVYVYMVLYKLSGDTIYLEYAQKHVQILEKLISFDKQYDLISGNAGVVLVLVKMFEIIEDYKYVSLAEKALEVIEINAVKMLKGIGWCSEYNSVPMAGIAHGNAGILMAILSLYRITKKEKYKELAIKTWEYENSLYDCEINNWSDMRRVKQTKDTIGNIAWCHGAAGILLSRIVISDIEDEDIKTLIENDIYHAYKKIKKYYIRDSWCLCHGTCGNKWIIEYAEGKNNGKYEKLIGNYNVNLLLQEKLNPGLMSGYGGIIYYLLKEQGCHVYNILKLEI